jgi:acyl dehydratase
MQRFADVHELLAAPAGTALGSTDWREVTQAQIDSFADTTGDHQWIHVDPERAAEGPYGACIAHGMLTLSLVPVLIGELISVEAAAHGLNYGFEKVRFTAPVPAGSRVRGTGTLLRTARMTGGTKATFGLTVEIEGAVKPACVAEQVIVWLT